jgi:hypothetical protein
MITIDNDDINNNNNAGSFILCSGSVLCALCVFVLCVFVLWVFFALGDLWDCDMMSVPDLTWCQSFANGPHSHSTLFDSNLFTCRLKGPVRREVSVNLFFHILKFSLCRGYNLGMQNLVSASFFMILYLILI